MTMLIESTEWQEFDPAAKGYDEGPRRSGWPTQALPLTQVSFNPCCPLADLPTFGFRVRVDGRIVVEGPWWAFPPAPSSRPLAYPAKVPEGALLRVELLTQGTTPKSFPLKLPVYLIFSGFVDADLEDKR